MIRLRIATSEGFQEITPETLSHCGFTNGCRHAGYVDGPADPDPYYHCDLYNQRTDGKRLPHCINATNPVIVESLRDKAEQYAEQYEGYSRTIEVPFPWEHRRVLSSEIPHGKWPLVYHTLRFEQMRCVCDTHGAFRAALLPGEKPWCSRCIQDWLDEMRAVLLRIIARALAHLHRARMNTEHRMLRAGLLPDSMLYPGAEWTGLSENSSWNPIGASL